MYKSSNKGGYADGGKDGGSNKLSHNVNNSKSRDGMIYDRNYVKSNIYNRRDTSRDRYDYKRKRYNDLIIGNDKHHRSVHDHSDYESYYSSDDDNDNRYGRKRRHERDLKTRSYNKQWKSSNSKRLSRYERERYRKSQSPQTPKSESKSPINNKYSPPPLPPFEPPSSIKTISGDVNKNDNTTSSNVIPFNQFAETKKLDSKCKDNGPDPRLTESFYGTKVVNKFDIVSIPKNSNIDNILESPTFTLDMDWNYVQSLQAYFQTPLERINQHLAFIRPKIENEWWLKGINIFNQYSFHHLIGTLSLLVIGIPRNWNALDALNHLVESYIRYSSKNGKVKIHQSNKRNQKIFIYFYTRHVVIHLPPEVQSITSSPCLPLAVEA